MMKKLLFTVLLFTTVFRLGLSQDKGQETGLQESILNSEMKVFFAQNIQLTTAETDQFWNIYDKFESELKPIVDERFSLLKNILQNKGKIPETEIDGMIKEVMKLKKKRIALRAKYYRMYKKKMGINVASQFYKLDQYISALASVTMSEDFLIVKPG